MPGRRMRVVLSSVALAAGLVVPLVAAQPAGSAGLFAITQNVLPGLANATDLGAAPGSAPLHLVVSAARPTRPVRPRRWPPNTTRPARVTTTS